MSLAGDTNMANGQSYTFTFSLGNWFSLPNIQTLVTDLQNYGPNWASSIVANWLPNVNPFQNILTVTFTYTGDGSDVISDAGQEFVTAFQQGSSDSFTFTGADSGYGSSASPITGAITSPDQSSQCGLSNLGACLPSSSQTSLILVVVAVIAVAVIFLSPGGQALAVSRSAA